MAAVRRSQRARLAAHWHLRAVAWLRRTDIGAAIQHAQRVRECLRGMPVDADVASLGIAVCRELVNQAWRVGTPAAEVRATLDEGCLLADSIGDARASVILSLVYSRTLCGAGDVAGYVELAQENLRAAEAMDDAVLRANAHAFLADALRIAGRVDETIAVAIEADARDPAWVTPDMWLIGI